MSLSHHFAMHRQSLRSTLKRLWHAKISTLLNVLVLAVAIALPSFLFGLVQQLQGVHDQWQLRPQFSAYLNIDANEKDVKQALEFAGQHPLIDDFHYITPDAGLEQFKQQTQLNTAIELIEDNPLPGVLVIYPARYLSSLEIDELNQELDSWPQVESTQFDLEWVQRLAAISALLKQVIYTLAALISVGITLLIANTVRLEISQRQSEIAVIAQLGGTGAFIARPFLYYGAIIGSLGALVGAGLTAISTWLLNPPILNLIELYQSQVTTTTFSSALALGLLVFGCLLGWLASAFTVHQQLRTLNPQ